MGERGARFEGASGAGRAAVQAAPGGDPLIGATLGAYQVVGQIGRGGTGVVYRAVHPLLALTVAVKVLKPELSRDKATRARFVSEAQAASRVQHPNVVQVLDLFDLPDGRLAIAEEFFDGAPLDVVACSEPMPLGRAVRILTQLASALSAAHARGVIHRDVKCENVLVGAGDAVKLLDFGLAHAPGASPSAAGLMLGTPVCMAPEQITGGPVDARTDIYALGVLAYRLLAGRFPFEGSEAQLLASHLKDPPPSLRGVPAPAEAAVRRAMSKDPAARQQTAAEFGRELSSAAVAAPALVAVGARSLTVTFDTDAALAQCEQEELRLGRFFLAGVFGLPPGTIAVELRAPGRTLAFIAEVATVLQAAEAERFCLSPGTALSVQRASLRYGVPSGDPSRARFEDALRALERLESAAARSHYAFLGVSPTAARDELEAGLRRTGAALDSVRRAVELAGPTAATSAGLDPAAEGARARLEALEEARCAAAAVLTDAGARLDYDGEVGNWRGVLAALEGGVDVDVFVRAREAFIWRHPARVHRARQERAVAAALRPPRSTAVREAVERALQFDPFDAEAHRMRKALFGSSAGEEPQAPGGRRAAPGGGARPEVERGRPLPKGGLPSSAGQA